MASTSNKKEPTGRKNPDEIENQRSDNQENPSPLSNGHHLDEQENSTNSEDHQEEEEVSTVEIMETNHIDRITNWDEMLARCVAREDIQSVDRTTDMMEQKTDSHSSGRSSSASSSSTHSRPEQLELGVIQPVLDAQDPDGDMDLDLEPVGSEASDLASPVPQGYDEGVECPQGEEDTSAVCVSGCNVCSGSASGSGPNGSSIINYPADLIRIGGPLGEELMRRMQKPISTEPILLCKSSDFVGFWSEMDARRLAVNSQGPSSCGVTALGNVLKALKWKSIDWNRLRNSVKTRLRATGSSLAVYLLSRSNAGATAEDMANGMREFSEGVISSRFFPWPTHLGITKFLAKWIKKGVVPVLTMNLQTVVQAWPHPQLADAWHHQMVYGATAEGLARLTNPLETVNETYLARVLDSPSWLLVKSQDVLDHWYSAVEGARDLTQLLSAASNDHRWTEANVIGQIVNLVRENESWQAVNGNSCSIRPKDWTTHICIPAAYKAGVTLFGYSQSPEWAEVLEETVDLEEILEESTVEIFEVE